MKDITNSDSISKVLLRMEKRNGECYLINLYGEGIRSFQCFTAFIFLARG